MTHWALCGPAPTQPPLIPCIPALIPCIPAHSLCLSHAGLSLSQICHDCFNQRSLPSQFLSFRYRFFCFFFLFSYLLRQTFYAHAILPQSQVRVAVHVSPAQFLSQVQTSVCFPDPFDVGLFSIGMFSTTLYQKLPEDRPILFIYFIGLYPQHLAQCLHSLNVPYLVKPISEHLSSTLLLTVC